MSREFVHEIRVRGGRKDINICRSHFDNEVHEIGAHYFIGRNLMLIAHFLPKFNKHFPHFLLRFRIKLLKNKILFTFIQMTMRLRC